MTAHTHRVLEALRDGPKTGGQLAAITGSAKQLHSVILELRQDRGCVIAHARGPVGGDYYRLLFDPWRQYHHPLRPVTAWCCVGSREPLNGCGWADQHDPPRGRTLKDGRVGCPECDGFLLRMLVDDT